jgi:archaellum biogenesis ATPase FlaH
MSINSTSNNADQLSETLGEVHSLVDKLQFRLLSAAHLVAKPVKIEWLLEGIIEKRSLNLLFGEPGTGKSLFALDWAFCIANGIGWHGCRTEQTGVVIIAGEGHSGIARRLKALERKYQIEIPVRLAISEQPAQLLNTKNAQLVADSIQAICPNPGLVIIDTLHRNMDGDENSSQDIGRFINNLDRFIRPLDAAVLIVHHSGHSDKQRGRGSSSIRAAMDGEFSASKKNGSIILSCHKAKDFEVFKPLQFSLKRTNLDWADDDGKPQTSVYLEYEGVMNTTSKKQKLSSREEAIFNTLNEAIADHGVEPTSDIKDRLGIFDKEQKIVHIDYWRKKAYPVITVDTDDAEKSNAKRTAFKRCREKLSDHGLIVEYDDYVWRIPEHQVTQRNIE